MKDKVYSPYNKYSTDEQIVGEWIDGKTLYRKVLASTMPTITSKSENTTKEITINASIENMVNISGYSVQNYEDTVIYWPIPYANTIATYHLYVSYIRGTKKLRISSNIDWLSEAPITFIMEYTKTTD